MEHAIYTKNFTKSYGSFLALKGIDLEVRTGEIFGFQNSELFNFSKSSNQVLLTPHIGGMTIDAQEIAYGHAVKLLEEFLKN